MIDGRGTSMSMPNKARKYGDRAVIEPARVIQELEDRDAAAKQADAPAEEVTIDINAVKPLLVELAELLDSDLMEAMNRLDALEQHLGSSKVREEFSQLTKHINGFDTDGAKESLTNIAQQIDVSL
jgi:hypothetical protein